MVKRRLAIVVTAAALGLGGMATSALADDGLVRVHGGSELRGGKLTCWLSDGEVVTFSKAKVAELVEERFVEPELAETVVDEYGRVTVPADRLSISVPTRELPRKAVSKKWRGKRVVHLTCVWDDRRK
ncbi:hypothetical protein GCM10022224_029510 [Nonomuraea antimicrobica]|uniref:Uncharacterized protein n=1 Tax=Nonomuraea antimicrobica TaxID=561173 RepID=A0ABP7BNJ3_9ACTN